MEEILFNQSYRGIKKVIDKSANAEFYSKIYKEVGINLTKDFSYDVFKKIPMLTKDIYNKNKFSMMTSNIFNAEEYLNLDSNFSAKREYLNNKGLQLKVTSGSTGTPVEVIKSNSDNANDYLSLSYYRRKFTSYNFKGKFLWIWPVNPLTRKFFYSEEDVEEYIKINQHGYQYMLYEHSESRFEMLYKIMLREGFEWITSSPSVISNFSEYLLKNGFKICNIKYIECHSEYLYTWQRALIIKAFGVDPISIYSSNEIQFIGGMCSQERYHLFLKNCFVEFVDAHNGSKEICITSLNYFDIPIIRYKLGDCGEWDTKQQCLCKLDRLPTFKLKGFRTNDFVISPSGLSLEPFIITDSIVLLRHSFNLNISKYRVEQKRYDFFEYLFSTEMASNVNEDMVDYLQGYLSRLLKYKVKVSIKCVDFCNINYDGKKFRYFEVDQKLIKNHKKKFCTKEKEAAAFY